MNLNVKKSMSIVWQSQYNKIILSENDRDTKRRIQMKKRVLSMLLVASMSQGRYLQVVALGKQLQRMHQQMRQQTQTPLRQALRQQQMRLRQMERQSLSNGQSGIRRPLLTGTHSRRHMRLQIQTSPLRW